MPEFQFDPATGESVEIGRGAIPVEDGPSAQELADIHQARSIENTARHLTQRQNNISDVGANPNLEAEAALQQLQAQLFAGDFANPIEEQILLQKCEQLAQSLVGGGSPEQKTQQAPSKSEGQQYADSLAEEDTELMEALNSAVEILEVSAIENVNEILGDDDPFIVQNAANAVKQITPDMIAGSDFEGSTELDAGTMSFLTSYAGEEVAEEIQLMAAAVATGKISRAGAMRTAMKSQKHLNAMLAAAADPNINFRLAL